MRQNQQIQEGQLITGPLFNEAMRIESVRRHAYAQAIEAFSKRRVAEDRRDCYWLYVVTNCSGTPTLQEPIKDPARFPWHEVSKVAHYWLEVNAMTKPMMVREDQPPYGEKTS